MNNSNNIEDQTKISEEEKNQESILRLEKNLENQRKKTQKLLDEQNKKEGKAATKILEGHTVKT